jgi:hypothetical protein
MSRMIWPHQRHPRELGAMVEAQARHWMLKQSVPWNVRAEALPIVTISREVGDQDHVLGRNVAGRLGFSYWDHDIEMELTHRLPADKAASLKLDKQLRDRVGEVIGIETPKGRAVPADYEVEMRLIVNQIARRGRVVVDCRGAEFFGDPCNTLRVRFVTPLVLRVRRVETRDRISFKAAKKLVLSGDRERAEFLLRAMGHDGTDPGAFDLIINTETYAGERAVGMVLMAYFAKFGDLPRAAQALGEEQRPGRAMVLPPIQAMAWTTGRSL